MPKIANVRNIKDMTPETLMKLAKDQDTVYTMWNAWNRKAYRKARWRRSFDRREKRIIRALRREYIHALNIDPEEFLKAYRLAQNSIYGLTTAKIFW